MAERAEAAIKQRYPGLGEDLVIGLVQTALMAATAEEAELRVRLPVIAASAAVKPETELVECLLVGHEGNAWGFDLGPIAARTFGTLLGAASTEIEQR